MKAASIIEGEKYYVRHSKYLREFIVTVVLVYRKPWRGMRPGATMVRVETADGDINVVPLWMVTRKV